MFNDAKYENIIILWEYVKIKDFEYISFKIGNKKQHTGIGT